MTAALPEPGGDPRWDAFVDAMQGLAPLHERRSRYADKPALFLDGREIAHLEAPGFIDLRITYAGWARVRATFGNDPAVRPDKSRRDWLELVPGSADDVGRLLPLLAMAVACNQR